MSTTFEKFSEQFPRIQQQFDKWTLFERLQAIIELTRSFELSSQHFLSQLFQINIQCANDAMFNHTYDNANAPDIVNCLMAHSLDKILSTIHLYLPLISSKPINEKLLDAYRVVLIYLDSNMINGNKFNDKEKTINLSQQILFFIQINPYLKHLLVHIPQIVKLVQTNKFQFDEQQLCYQPIQRYSSTRTKVQSLMNYTSENVISNGIYPQQLARHDTGDSGLGLSDSSISNSIQNFLSATNSQQTFYNPLNRTNLSSSFNQHTTVAKTVSSPIPEHVSIELNNRTPLKSVKSAPSSTIYSDSRYKNGNYAQKHIPILAKSDEEEAESHLSNDEYTSEHGNQLNGSKTLPYSQSFRLSNTKVSQIKDNPIHSSFSDVNAFSSRNTFIRDIAKWLRCLRLHKYYDHFAQMTYDKMMNLTLEELKDLTITDGACAKIILNIKKLKERSIVLQQWLVEMDDPQCDLQNYVEKLNELMITPIRSKQMELENNSDEDLPSLIMQVLEKINQKLTPNTSSDIANGLIGLCDSCYGHSAFTDKQRDTLLRWRGRLSNTLQSLGKLQYKKIQSTLVHSAQQRRTGKVPLRHNKSSGSATYWNSSSTAIPMSKYKSDPANNFNDSNLIGRSNRSSTQIFTTNGESNENYLQSSFNCLTTSQNNNSTAYLVNNQRQTLTRKPSINPYDESDINNKPKLCKTYSEPNKMRFCNLTQQLNTIGLSSQTDESQSFFQMISTPYSQQPRHFVSRSPPINMMDIPASPIKKCFSDIERSDYYANENSGMSLSNSNNIIDMENFDDQKHQNAEIDSFYREITESAMSDDTHDLLIQQNDEPSDLSTIKQGSTDIEQ